MCLVIRITLIRIRIMVPFSIKKTSKTTHHNLYIRSLEKRYSCPENQSVTLYHCRQTFMPDLQMTEGRFQRNGTQAISHEGMQSFLLPRVTISA